MDKDVRKKLISDLRVHWEPAFKAMGIPNAYYCCKHAHYHDGGDEKVIGLFDSEMSKGDIVFIEFTSMDYIPSDASRKLYKWEHNPHWKDTYKRNEKTSQWLIPTSELHVVSSFDKNGKWDGEMKEVSLKQEKIPVPTFEKKEETHQLLREEVWIGFHNIHHTIKYRNNVPYEYVQGTGKPTETIILHGESLLRIIDFFKHLK